VTARRPDADAAQIGMSQEGLALRRQGLGAKSVRLLIRAYQLTLSSLTGRTCRHLPTCSEFAEVAIGRHGLWAGLWMALARFGRCHPLGSDGFDPVPDTLPAGARWYRPWRYGRWTGRHIEHRFSDTK
jgi:putative membrane protein insertion efficiency factor